MTISTVHLGSLNADPIPDDAWGQAVWGPTLGPLFVIYGDASAGSGSTVLDSADTDTSYIEIGSDYDPGTLATSHIRVVTARPVLVSPAIPGSADPDQFGQALAVNATIKVEARSLAPDTRSPYFIAYSSLDLGAGQFRSQAFSWVPTTFDALGDWVDQDTIGPPSYGYFVNAANFIATLRGGGYFVIAPGNARFDSGIQFSQIIPAVGWVMGDLAWHTVGGHFSTVGPGGLKILTPGRGWVDVVDGPA